MDLDRFFAMGPDTPISAQDVFTNRASELGSFDRSLSSVAHPDPVAVVTDTRAPRRNVLAFYGMGGVGKTKLSSELERRLLAGSDDIQRLSFRADFDEGAASDLESVFIGLRATLGRHRAVWPAFDLGFAAYWERAHPGVPMQAMLKTTSAARRLGAELDLGGQMQDAIEDLLDSPGGVIGIFTKGARLVGRSVAEQVRQRRLLEDCPFFAPVVGETEPGKMRPYLAALLAWDLAQVQADIGLQLVCFFDTWERVQQHESRRGGVEDHLARAIYLMPNVLFVVTGRNRLRWADPEATATMYWGGPRVWPQLLPGSEDDPRQHLVGSLSDEDAGRYMRERLVRDDEPAIPAEIRRRIVDAADGLPLYLDLAATHFDAMVARGETPTPEDFGHSLPEVVLRIMRDLDGDERDLLRAAALVHRFDEGFLTAAVPRLADAARRRFLDRTFVSREPKAWLPYSLHEALREAVRDRDEVTADHWSEREWQLAIDRLLEEMQRRVAPELAASGSVDLSRVRGLFMEAFRLAVLRGVAPPWLVETAARLQSQHELAVLAWTDSCVTPGDALQPLAVGLAAVGRRRERGHAETAASLRRALEDERLDASGRDYLTIWLAWMVEGLGDRDTARALRLELAYGEGAFVKYARHAVGRADWVEGRFARALSWDFDLSDPLERRWAKGIAGHVALALGCFDEAEETFRAGLDAAEAMGSPDLTAHALRNVGEVRCWSRPGDDVYSPKAVAIYERLGIPVSRGEALTSIAIGSIGRDDPVGILEKIAEARELMRGGGYADVAETFLHCVHGDEPAARQARQQLLAGSTGDAYGFWDAITGWWLSELSGMDEPGSTPDVEWLHGVEDARRRWVAVLEHRRASV